jgi:L-asparaginase II
MGKPIRVIGTRGKVVETEHDIVYAVVRDEKVIDSGGDIDLNRAMRSSAKLIQAIVCVETGAASAYRLTPAELAVIASSHNGNDIHVRAIRRILAKCGVSENHFQCGLHSGVVQETIDRLLPQGHRVKRIHHNCSGKHAGIIASCKHMGWPLDTYRSPKHPWNRRVFELISLFTDIPAKKVSYAIDGCGVPVIFTPVRESAIAYARYGTPDNLPVPIAAAARRIAAAVNRHPYHNSGRTRFLAALYKAAPGKFVAKEGGQGVFCLGVLDTGMGLAVKILDGRNYSYNPYEPALIHLLKRHGLLTRSQLSKLKKYRRPEIVNSRKETVGYLQVVEQ